MKRKFRVTIWIGGYPFSAFFIRGYEAIEAIEAFTQKPFDREENIRLDKLVIDMIKTDGPSDAIILRDEKGDALVSLSFINPMEVASIVA